MARALFYSAELGLYDLALAVLDLKEATVDVIDFADEAGGDQDRKLALPYLHGMDAVVVDAAALTFKVGDKPLEITGYTVSDGPGGGIVVRLTSPGRLRKLDLTYVAPVPPPPATAPPEQSVHLIVRAPAGAGWGPPMFADPDFEPAGPTFGRALSGMSVQDAPGDRHVVTLPDIGGTAFLVQVAFAPLPTDATPASAAAAKLAPQTVKIVVNRVIVAAAPRNLSITLKGKSDVPLWGAKDALLPSSGPQTTTFGPLAQKQLSDALKIATQDAPTLPLALRFHSDSGATLEILDRTLSGHYACNPLASGRTTLRMGGRPALLTVNAPVGLTPKSAVATLTAKLLGRALNAGSSPGALAGAGFGVRLGLDRTAAARVPIRPRDATSDPVPLASVALRLTATEATELVLELRADTAGRPGEVLAPAIVRQLVAGFDGWLDLELTAPLAVAADSAVWPTVRLTKGAVLWHASPGPPAAGGATMVSADKGASWGGSTADLRVDAPLAAQVFHRQDPPFARPKAAFRLGDTELLADWLAGAAPPPAPPPDPKEFRLTPAGLPVAALKAISATKGQTRADTTFMLYSDSVFDLVVSDMTLAYDPATARAP